MREFKLRNLQIKCGGFQWNSRLVRGFSVGVGVIGFGVKADAKSMQFVMIFQFFFWFMRIVSSGLLIAARDFLLTWV